MKKIFLLCFVFSQTYTTDYSLVLLGKDKDNEYCFSKIKLDDLKTSPLVNESNQLIRLMDSSHLLRLITYSVYSTTLKLDNGMYSSEIDPNEPRNCFCEVNDKLYPPEVTYLTPIIKKVVIALVKTYYNTQSYFGIDPKQVNNIDCDLVKYLTQIIGEEKITLLFKANADVEFYCACIIEDYELYDCITSLVFDYHTTI